MADLSETELQELERLRDAACLPGEWKFHREPHPMLKAMGLEMHAPDPVDAAMAEYVVALANAHERMIAELQRRRASDALREEDLARLQDKVDEYEFLLNRYCENPKAGDTEAILSYRHICKEARRIAEQPHEQT